MTSALRRSAWALRAGAVLLGVGLLGCAAAPPRPQMAPGSLEPSGRAPRPSTESQTPSASKGELDAEAKSDVQAGGYGAESSAAGAVPSSPYPAAGTASPRYATPPAGDRAMEGMPTGDQQRVWLEDFLVAEAALMASGASCVDACRALRSMQRATAGLCSMARTRTERESCDAAGDRYKAARARVRSACGQCTGGPDLEPDAPIDDGR